MPRYKPRQIEKSDRVGRIIDRLRPKSKDLLIRMATGVQLSGDDGRMLPALREHALVSGNALTTLGCSVAAKIIQQKESQ